MPVASEILQDVEMTVSDEHKVERKSKKKKSKKSKQSPDGATDITTSPPCSDTDVAVSSPSSSPTKKSKKRKLTHDSGVSDVGEDALSEKKRKKKKKKKQDEQMAKENGEAIVDDVKVADEAPLSADEIAGAFENFRISKDTVDKLKARGVTYLFPIQSKTFNYVYDCKDIIAQARTGTGKTFSFVIPLVEKLKTQTLTQFGRPPKVLALVPTRELATQVSADFESVAGKISVMCAYGGTPYGPQANAIRRGFDVLVGTPGRILDLVTKGSLQLGQLDHVVLDEVDRMLDMGFAESVEQILSHAYNMQGMKEANPQTCLFSATLPIWVHQTAKKYMRDDVAKVDMIGQQMQRTATTVQHLAIRCSYQARASTIGTVLRVYGGRDGRSMVFCDTKRDADELSLSSAIQTSASVLHGDVPQDKRERVLKSFRDGRCKCLIATDVAARGLDIPEVDLVIQCCPPHDVESYIHRSGRTGRAGRTGVCICFYKPQEQHALYLVEKNAGIQFKKIGPPTPADIVKSSVEDTVRLLDSVSDSMVQHFHDSATQLIAEKGAVAALSMALAAMAGGGQDMKERSLLSSAEGFTTYIFRTSTTMERTAYCWRALEQQLADDVRNAVTGMCFIADMKGCAFDLPSEHNDTVSSSWQDSPNEWLERAKELPELLRLAPSYGAGGRRGGGRGGWGRGGGRGGGAGRWFGGGGRGGGNGPKRKFF